MHPTFEGQGLQLTMPHQFHGMGAGFLLMLLTVFSALRFAEALVSVEKERRTLWVIVAGVIAGYCRFCVQLCFLDVLQVPQSTSFDLTLFLLALAVTIGARTVAFRSVIREDIRLRLLLQSSLFEAAVVLGTQLLLLRAAHYSYPLQPVTATVTYLFAVAVFFLSQVSAAMLLRRTVPAWRNTRFAFPVASVLFALSVRYLATFALQRPRPRAVLLDIDPRALQVPHVIIPFLVTTAVTLLFVTHAALFLYWGRVRWSRGLAEAEREKEIAKALAEQRAMRMQNESLLEEIRERKKAEAKLAAFAFTDSITGLHNRVHLHDCLRSLLQRKRSRVHSFHALLYIDLDNFKSANDMLGHGQGDALLVAVAKCLRKVVTEDDVLVRLGGDEFAVLLNCASSAASALRLAQRLLTVLEQPIEISGHSFCLSASVGVCAIDSGYNDPDLVLRDADLAMYSAKREGGARAVMFVPEMYSNMLRDIEDRKELARAIQDEEFVLWYQPLVDMQDGTIYGSEALIRWQHPTRGLLGPYTFIRLAEETGRIIEIGNWVLRTACRDFRKFQERSSRPLLLSLNVSAKQLELPNYMDLLKQTLEETDMPATQLQLEITESILMTEPARMGTLLQEIRALGVRIAFDDFGTGYSSLSYIQKFPVDTLKIDQSFVRSLIDSPVNGKIIQMMMGLSDAMGMSISVEGVETEFEANTLLRFGARIAQGFLYSRPVDMETFFKLMAQKSLIPTTTLHSSAA